MKTELEKKDKEEYTKSADSKQKRAVKKWEELDITDDYIFSKFMRDPATCKEVLEILLPFKVGSIEYVEYQKTIEVAYDAKGVRLDVYVKDTDKTYNIEMQVGTVQNLPKRVRYYEACIDFDEMEKGFRYNALHDSYIIFICTFDPFGKGLPCYSFNNVCQEDNDIVLNDGRYSLFFNTKAYLKEKDMQKKNFLAFVNGEKTEDTKTKTFSKKISDIKTNKEWRMDYMNLALKFDDMHYAGYEQGIEQGIEKGAHEKAIKVAKEMLRDGVSIVLIKQYTGLTEEEIRSIEKS